MKPLSFPTGPNPWLAIPAADYEGHMGPEGTGQLAPLAAIFAEVVAAVRPASLALLGCATGNGLAAVDTARTRRAVAVDVNPEYLEVARRRHASHLGGALELVCADLTACELGAGAFELVHAALVFEHVDPVALAARIARWLAPGGTCAVVLQLPAAAGRAPAVSPTRFSSLQALAGSMRLCAPEEVRRLFAAHGLGETRGWRVPLRDGKAFYVGLFGRAAAPAAPPLTPPRTA
jgi:SAM-dependent methyltransferase